LKKKDFLFVFPSSLSSCGTNVVAARNRWMIIPSATAIGVLNAADKIATNITTVMSSDGSTKLQELSALLHWHLLPLVPNEDFGSWHSDGDVYVEQEPSSGLVTLYITDCTNSMLTTWTARDKTRNDRGQLAEK
jgi:hypothetical protein